MQETLNHYLRVAYGDLANPDTATAAELAAENVHEPARMRLATLGEVETLTDPNTGDTSCTYAVSYSDHLGVVISLSAVLPYSSVAVMRGGRFAEFADAGVAEGDWVGQVVAALHNLGFLVLPAEICRAISPVVDQYTGKFLTYYEALFTDENGTP